MNTQLIVNPLTTNQSNATQVTTINNTRVARMGSVKKIFCAALISSLAVSPVFAGSYENIAKEKAVQERIAKENDAQLKEEIGLGTGMIIGAIFGGPVGAFITGVAGNLIAKNMNAEDEVENLSTAYIKEKQNNELALARYQSKIEQSEQRYKMELLALEQNYQATGLLQAQNLLMSLQFSTGSSEIKSHYEEQIASLASIVQQSPNLSVDLSGYTDKQGSEALNQALSLARINAVKNALIDQGVKADRIHLFAFGEQESVVASTDKEVSFYDRRVVIKLKNTAMSNEESNQAESQTAKNF
jgi:sortase system peptidoglycan-associated protein